MNTQLEFDENLSDEILDEQVDKKKIINSLHLDRKIAESPFEIKPAKNRLCKASSLPIDMKKQRGTHDFESIIVKRRLTKKEPSQIQKSSRGLQSDIRSLLQKAIKLRNHRSHGCKEETIPLAEEDFLKEDEEYIPHGITMKDIKNTFSF